MGHAKKNKTLLLVIYTKQQRRKTELMLSEKKIQQTYIAKM